MAGKKMCHNYYAVHAFHNILALETMLIFEPTILKFNQPITILNHQSNDQLQNQCRCTKKITRVHTGWKKRKDDNDHYRQKQQKTCYGIKASVCMCVSKFPFQLWIVSVCLYYNLFLVYQVCFRRWHWRDFKKTGSRL